ncbi:MAG: MFS transporter [Chloroflexota bacterium]|nr:MFS transporter [Chloroflexota bacterium]MDE2942467.1 MFS transporter [Chloroflexota bacterium]MDE3267853.1 MFS transporter [Chloroflexota bacterium]
MRRVFYGWYIVAASVGLNFYLSIVFFQGFQVFFLPILNEFGWSRAVTSGAFSLRQLESGLLAPFIGFLVDRWGPRVVILAGILLGAAGMIMMGFINSLWTFYAAFLIASLGTSGSSHGVSWSVAVANWFDRLRGRALGIAMMGPVVGGPFVVVVAVLNGWFGWRSALILLGIGMLVVGIPLGMVARSRPEKYGMLPDGDTHPRTDESQSASWQSAGYGHSDGMTVAEAVATREFWLLMVLFASMFMGISGLMVHLIPMMEDMGYSSAQAAAILGIMFLLSGIGRVGAGFLADVLDFVKVMVGLIAFQIVGLLLLVMIGPGQLWLVGLFLLLFGIGFGGTIPLRPFLMMQIFGPHSFGALQGLVQGGAIGAGMVGPVFYGWVFDTRGSYDLAIYASIGTILVSLPLLFFMRKPSAVALSVR